MADRATSGDPPGWRKRGAALAVFLVLAAVVAGAAIGFVAEGAMPPWLIALAGGNLSVALAGVSMLLMISFLAVRRWAQWAPGIGKRLVSLLIFVVVFGIGAALILAGDDAGAALLPFADLDRVDGAVLIGLAAMLIYLVLAAPLAGLGWMRGQRLADNIYYLGFLFTLVALVAALRALETTGLVVGQTLDRMIELVGNTAFALVTTIAGLAARLLVQQLLPDRDADERPAVAKDLEEELENLRVAIAGVTAKLDQLGETAGQRSKEASEGAAAAILDAGKEVAETLRDGLKPRVDAFADEVEAAAGRVSRVQLDSSALARQLDDKLKRPMQEIGEVADDLGNVGYTARDAGDGLSKLIVSLDAANRSFAGHTAEIGRIGESIGAVEAQHRRTSEAATSAMTGLGEAVDDLKGRIASLDERIDGRQQAVQDRTQALEAQLESWVRAIGSLNGILQHQTESTKQTLDELEKAVGREGCLETVRRLKFVDRWLLVTGRPPKAGT